MRDPQFVERMSVHNARLATIDAEIRSIERQLASPTRQITPAILEKFSALMRQRLRDPNPAPRQGYVRLLLDEVVIADDLITMRGSKKALEHAIFANNGALGEVPTFIRDWRARQDSNL